MILNISIVNLSIKSRTMGRSPCCEKAHTNKGVWSKEEDQRLVAYIRANGDGCWRSLPKAAGLQRCGKSCRLRWMNYLRPDLKRGNFTEEEDELIIKLHAVLGNKWSVIAARLPGRTDNEIKNYWNTHIKRKLTGQGLDPRTHLPLRTTPTIYHEIQPELGLTTTVLGPDLVTSSAEEVAAAGSSSTCSNMEEDNFSNKINLELSISLPFYTSESGTASAVGRTEAVTSTSTEGGSDEGEEEEAHVGLQFTGAACLSWFPRIHHHSCFDSSALFGHCMTFKDGQQQGDCS